MNKTMNKIDCNNMNDDHTCNLDRCTCGYTKGKCKDMVCEDYVSIEEWIVELTETDCEIWNSDLNCESREEAISLGVPLAQEDGLKSFRIGRKISVGVPTLNIDAILEDAYDQVCDEVGESAEDFLNDVTKEQQEELEEELNKVFFNWVVKNKLEPTCYTIVNDEVIEIG